jgi:hypothetical protein
MKRKSGVFLIVASMVVASIAALPMIINQDDALLMPGMLLGGVLFLAGVVSVFRPAARKDDTKQVRQRSSGS